MIGFGRCILRYELDVNLFHLLFVVVFGNGARNEMEMCQLVKASYLLGRVSKGEVVP